MGVCYSYPPELVDHKFLCVYEDIILLRTQIKHINMALDTLNRDMLKFSNKKTPSVQTIWEGDNETGKMLFSFFLLYWV